MPTELISKDEAVKKLEKYVYRAIQMGECAALIGFECLRIVRNIPAWGAQIRGKWIDGKPYTNSHWKVCSVCHGSAHEPAGGDNFCPKCGAMMEE